MCTAVLCQRCGKTTWAGCGDHIEEALAGIPTGDLCDCPESRSSRVDLSGSAHHDRPEAQANGLRAKFSRLLAGR